MSAINQNNLGYLVSTQTIDYRQMVILEWGPEWNMNDIAYEWSSGRKFDSTDKYTSGIYTRS